ncbi:hypothetical protein [Moorena sp. SIO3I8]|nr:hypothetical protein [Moorena sp. SIO3I8]
MGLLPELILSIEKFLTNIRQSKYSRSSLQDALKAIAPDPPELPRSP